MKLKLYDQEDEKTRTLRLIKKRNSIKVVACDEKGEVLPGGYLVVFKDNGKIHRCTGVAEYLGFKLDDENKVREE